MANTLTNAIPVIMTQALQALRQNAIMPQLVNRTYEPTSGEPGQSIDITVPATISITDVTGAATPPANVDITPTKKTLTLNKHKEASFHLTDKELEEVQAGYMPAQMSEAMKALGNQVDNDILATYTESYAFAGTAGTAPFASDLTAYLTAQQRLNENLAAKSDRHCVINAAAQANALGIRAIQDASYRRTMAGAIDTGEIGNILGATWWMDQNIPQHTAGAWSGTIVVSGVVSAGLTSIVVDGCSTGGCSNVVGDIISFGTTNAGRTYVVTAAASAASGAALTLAISPALVEAIADNEGVALKASHRVNLLIHRDAIAFGSRPLAKSVVAEKAGIIRRVVDPVTKLAFRLEITRGYKQDRWALDALYGVKMVRPEGVARIAG